MSLINFVYKDITDQENNSNEFAKLVIDQVIVEVPSYTLECGVTLKNFPVAYKTWGKLNKDKDNVIVICHALTGSSDVQDWWGPLLGSPYGSCSPLTIDKKTGKPYGPIFPLVTVKDDLGIQKLILDSLNIKSLACVIGGSMGGMIALEYSITFNNASYIKCVIALATCARASAWCISWNETQRQCIFSDPNYNDGYYYESINVKPDSGLSAARMTALLTYRSRNSFENRFGRNLPNDNPNNDNLNDNPNNNNLNDYSKVNSNVNMNYNKEYLEDRNNSSKNKKNSLIHNEGLRKSINKKFTSIDSSTPQTHFSVQSYLRYQGNKFIKRFDANCYISITRKIDTHDITRNRINSLNVNEDPLPSILKTINVPHLVIGIKSDGLFTYSEQQLLAQYIPDCELKELDSPEGHDAFLLEFDAVDSYCKYFLKEKIPEFFDPNSNKVELFEDWDKFIKIEDNIGNSVFGEAENITHW